MCNLGSCIDQPNQKVDFNLFSKNAECVYLYIYSVSKNANEIFKKEITNKSNNVYQISIHYDEFKQHGLDPEKDTIYYGYRCWGPNWTYTDNWNDGFKCDVDENGNRFNPYKLLIDPYAKEISHDPEQKDVDIDPNECINEYYTGEFNGVQYRYVDTGQIAPKSIVLNPDNNSTGEKPKRSLKDDVVYEVHLRGFTKLDSSIPVNLQGTYAGAALKAQYLKQLGVAAVEFLPIHDFADDQNDNPNTKGHNYWGYMTLGYFAPNRRYSSDKSPGGPTREFKQMVKAFHDAGIKVFMDVVYNHTAEGILRRTTQYDDSRTDDVKQDKDAACLLSLRGIDNASYYTLRSNLNLDNNLNNQRYQDNSACGGSLNMTNKVVSDFIIDSLKYWKDEMGVDGFRFDLAPVLGNSVSQGGYNFDRNNQENVLNRMITELPLRNTSTFEGVDLIAEPWATGTGNTYQLGRFPDGWAEWNDKFRMTFRASENKLNVTDVFPYQLSNYFAGSQEEFKNINVRSNPKPYNTINYIVSHDGYCMRDVYSYTADDAWDHGGDPAKQRKAVRNAFAILMMSAGVPMFTGGDELFRTLGGRTNTVAVDDDSVYLHWDNYNNNVLASDDVKIYSFARNIINFRNSCPALRPENYFTGQANPSGLKDIAWYQNNGCEFDNAYWSSGNKFIAFRIDNNGHNGIASIYVAYNRDQYDTNVIFPQNLPGKAWCLLFDTSEWMENTYNTDSNNTQLSQNYGMHERSLIVLIEKQV